MLQNLGQIFFFEKEKTMSSPSGLPSTHAAITILYISTVRFSIRGNQHISVYTTVRDIKGQHRKLVVVGRGVNREKNGCGGQSNMSARGLNRSIQRSEKSS